MPEGYGWCQECFNKFYWDSGCGIDLNELVIPQRPRVGDQGSFRMKSHDIQSAIFSKGETQTSKDMKVETKLDYNPDAIIYEVTIKNNKGYPINEVSMRPQLDPKHIVIDQKDRMITILRDGESKTISFKLWPKESLRKSDIKCEIKYLDPTYDEYRLKTTKADTIEIAPPSFQRVQIDDVIYNSISASLLSSEMEYKGLKVGTRFVFDMMGDVIRSYNLYLLEPNFSSGENYFRGVQKGYGEGGEHRFQCEMEVIGGHSRSNLLVRCLGSEPKTLLGFTAQLKDKIEKRIDVANLNEGSTIIQQHIHGDMLSGGATKVGIHDSVVQRSNIGSDIKTNDGLDERIEWLDKRNEDRTSELKKGQRKLGKGILEIKGMSKEMMDRMIQHFSETLKDFPYPSDISKKYGTVTLEYTCSLNDEFVGKIKDRRWIKWAHVLVGAGMVGIGIAGFRADMGAQGLKKIFNDLTGKQLDDYPKDSLFLTTAEKDKILTMLREEGILAGMGYCPNCRNWVCKDCFDEESGLCVEHRN